jgi:hypothetical protein
MEEDSPVSPKKDKLKVVELEILQTLTVSFDYP